MRQETILLCENGMTVEVRDVISDASVLARQGIGRLRGIQASSIALLSEATSASLFRTFPFLLSEGDRLVAMVPAGITHVLDADRCRAVTARLGLAERLADFREQPAGVSLGDVVAVSLQESGAATVYSAGGRAAIWLVSTERIPPVWKFAALGRPMLQQCILRPGDLLVLHSDPSGSAWPEGLFDYPPTAASLWQHARRGAAALRAHLQDRLPHAPGPFALTLFEM